MRHCVNSLPTLTTVDPMATDTKQEARSWWRVTGEEIARYSVVRHTEKTVIFVDPFYRERRSSRTSTWERWFQSEHDAVEHVRSALERRTRNAEADAVRLASRLASFNAAHPLPVDTEV